MPLGSGTPCVPTTDPWRSQPCRTSLRWANQCRRSSAFYEPSTGGELGVVEIFTIVQSDPFDCTLGRPSTTFLRPRSSPTDDWSSKLTSRDSSSTAGTDGRMDAQRFAGAPGPRCAHFRPWLGMPWPAVELWGTMDIRRSPDRCPFLTHDQEGPGWSKNRARMKKVN